MRKLVFSLLFFVSGATVLSAQSNRNFWARVQAGYGLCGVGDRTAYVGNFHAGGYFHPRFKVGFGIKGNNISTIRAGIGFRF